MGGPSYWSVATDLLRLCPVTADSDVGGEVVVDGGKGWLYWLLGDE